MQLTAQLREVVCVAWEKTFAISAGTGSFDGGSAARVFEPEAR